jgi:hypothetical protein
MDIAKTERERARAGARDMRSIDTARVARTANPFAEISEEAWLARLREGSKWQFYCDQFRLATVRQPNLGAA